MSLLLFFGRAPAATTALPPPLLVAVGAQDVLDRFAWVGAPPMSRAAAPAWPQLAALGQQEEGRFTWVGAPRQNFGPVPTPVVLPFSWSRSNVASFPWQTSNLPGVRLGGDY